MNRVALAAVDTECGQFKEISINTFLVLSSCGVNGE
jgi:hypothetical protein